MQSINPIPAPLVVIVGPTAVGKTEISIECARRLGGEIVSADSRLFYRGMDIGTAKPTLTQRAIVPHHLIDVCPPDQTWSVVNFQEAAAAAIAEIQARGKLPFLVGGTGQYIAALLEGWEVPAQQPDLRLREVLEAWGKEIGPEELNRRLALIDSKAASASDVRNLRRTVRALEVIFGTGRRFSDQKEKKPCPYSVCMIGLRRQRADLYNRIDLRIENMLNGGFLEEVKYLISAGYSADLSTMSAIGYREMVAVVQGKMTVEEAVVQIKRLSRQFVRRQGNWFKESNPEIHWFEAAEDPVSAMVQCILSPESWKLTGEQLSKT
jgi:tRNA dimethylallyltransferase